MLYYILPPIIIVLGTATLIFFLFRKVSQYPGGEQLLNNSQDTGLVREKSRAFLSALGQFGLKVLERTMHRFKLLSLKFHNTSNDWFHSIRKKRQEVMLAEKQDEVARKERDDLQRQQQRDVQPAAQLTQPEPLQIKKVRPLVGEISAGGSTNRRPVAAVQRKNQLEEVLIKRIAINPRDIEAYERLGDYYLEQQNLKDSLECYKQVLRLSPVHFKARAKIRKIERMLK